MRKLQLDEFGRYYVRHDQKLVYLPVSKNASMTMRNVVNGELHMSGFFDNIKKFKKKGYVSFAVIREPIDRLVSGYQEILFRAGIDAPLTTQKPFWKVRGQEEKFYAFIKDIKEEIWDGHVGIQASILTKGDNVIPTDYVFDCKTLTQDFQEMCCEHNVNLKPVVNHNESKGQSKKIDKEFIFGLINSDVNLLKDIEEIYRDDFTLYEKYGKHIL